MKKLTNTEIQQLFGLDYSLLDSMPDIRYVRATRQQEKEIILDVLHRIDNDDWNKKSVEYWDNYWGKVYNNFIKNDYNLDYLFPDYLYYHTFLRYNNGFILPESTKMQKTIIKLLLKYIVSFYIKDAHFTESILELGCGACHNLTYLWKNNLIDENALLYALDFAECSAEIADTLNSVYSMPIQGITADFKKELFQNISGTTAVFSVGGLEQIGSEWTHIINYMYKLKPEIIIHIEPLYELYDRNNLFDYLAMKFHKKRDYLIGYLPKIEGLERQGKAEIIFKNRMRFGSTFHDGWSILIWKPL